MWKWVWALVILVLVVGSWAWLFSGPARPAGAPAAEARVPQTPADCSGPATFVDAARINGASLETLAWAPFRRPETGWATYAPVIAAEVGTSCAPDSPGFAAAVAGWQAAHGLAASGRIDPGTVEPMRAVWMLRRPFVVATRDGACPEPPPADQLAEARADEIYGGKTLSLRADALDAYRRLVAAARREVPAAAGDPALLAIFSGFRDPAVDEARCAAEQNCGGPERANCSAHRTGLAVDLYLGAAPGLRPDTSDDANRRVLARSPTYLWMVRNAGRFGFVGYPFEPWHWEWSGAPA